MRKLIWFIMGLFMLESGAFAIDDNQKMLIKAMRKNDVSTVTSLIEKGTDLNFEMGLTPLVMAIRAGNLTLVDTMLAAGAEVNFTESQPANALVSAAATGNEVMLKRILDAGADINARAHGVPYRTALMQAS
ncbi:MAG: ankyrin repeat domain-containing protein, partial [Reinekea sp.]|nr:ankyrin repeat domain-containing protein [Reinekea sp.]